MARVRISFDIDVFDYPYRNPADWDWESLIEDDGIDVPVWSTLTVEEV
jgi:hypothetical protein